MFTLFFLFAQLPEPPLPPVKDDTFRESNDAKYVAARQEAIRTNKALYVYVNQKARKQANAIVLELWYPDVTGASVLRGVPRNGQLVQEEEPIMAIPFSAKRRVQTADVKLQERLVSLWPKDVEMPVGLQAYIPTRLSQRLTITNGVDTNLLYDRDQDDVMVNAFNVNPNHEFPWSVPGGLHAATGWESIVAKVGDAFVYDARVEAGARHPLPKKRWYFEEGTIFVDLLAHSGKPFELRMREKVDGKWVSRKVWEDKSNRPPGYNLERSCIDCHQHAGSQLQYGIGLRGDDGAFSWSPFE